MKPAYNVNNLYKKLINIYTEAVPNPNAMKFVANTMLVANEEVVKDYPDAASATDSPLAQELFKFPFVQRVFIASNFVTITKDEASDWAEHIPVIRHFLKNYLEEGSPVFEGDSAEQHAAINPNDSEAVKKIKGILDEYIRPAVEMDGGHIMFHSFEPETGIVKVLLQGSCSGCPSSTITLKAGIENLLTRMMPGEVKAVVAEGI
ncbi:MAG: NifU family protein [Cytophagales bacterium]|nr:NifU family protein [Bernardetiaceae bacterium]MDW8205892.1 NifU family protein [Cytophagales bacterium]